MDCIDFPINHDQQNIFNVSDRYFLKIEEKNGDLIDYIFIPIEKIKNIFKENPIATLAKDDINRMSDEELDANWKLNEYFGEIKLITTNTASERFVRTIHELEAIGLQVNDYTVFPGVNGSSIDSSIWKRAENWDPNDSDRQKKGRMGCFMAHYYAIKDSYDNLQAAQAHLLEISKQNEDDAEAIAQAEAAVKKYSSVLLLEDNVGFGHVTGDHTATLTGVGKRLRNILKDLPKDWDMFYFMTMADNWGPSTDAGKDIVRLNYGVLTKAYAVNAKMYGKIIAHFEHLIQSDKIIYPVDHALGELHKHSMSYAPKNRGLTYRFGSRSEVQDGVGEIKNWQPSVDRINKFRF